MNRSLVFLPLVILMAFTLGCQDQQGLAELEGMKAQAVVEEQNRELVLSFFEAWGNGDFDVLDDFMFLKPKIFSMRKEYKKGSFNESAKLLLKNTDKVKSIIESQQDNFRYKKYCLLLSAINKHQPHDLAHQTLQVQQFQKEYAL